MTSPKIEQGGIIRWSGKKPGGAFAGGTLVVPTDVGPEVSIVFEWAEGQLRTMGFTEGHVAAQVEDDFGG